MTDREKAAYLAATAAYDWNMAILLAKEWNVPQDLLYQLADEVIAVLETLRAKAMQ